MSSSAAPLLLTPKQVNEITQSNPASVSILDSTWFMPNAPRNAKDEFLSRRIPSAQYLDLDEVASPNALGLKHMMPSPQTFADACGNLGVTPSSHVIIYDSHGIFSAPRALFMFRTFGHANSSVIDGGLPRWADEGFAVETSAPTGPRQSSYPPPNLNDQAIRNYDQMVWNTALDPSASEIVLDARPKGRFTGKDPEPRPGLSSGHMPNSYSVPFNLFLQKHKTKDGREYTSFLPASDVRRILNDTFGETETEKIICGERSVITSCGSGMTAGVLWLGLQLLGAPHISLYDESWTGYAMRPTSKIEKD
jgi:thiosulfate/3-mercaptopyruvate sulfurtransferase